MSKATKGNSKPRANKYEKKLQIKGDFKDVFKVVKKNKEDKQTKKS
jgi:hypothetical protein